MGILKNFGPILEPDGSEQTTVDSIQTPGALPFSGTMSTIQIAGARPVAEKNLIIGGDFTTNPWQRGTSFTGIAATLTYTADRWAAQAATGASITVSRQSNTLTPGTQHALRFQRANGNTNTTPHRLLQIVESIRALRAQGQRLVLSFRVVAGANFSPVAGAINLVVASGTGTDESAANFIAGTWTGYTQLPTFTIAGRSTTVPGPNAGTLSGLENTTVLTPAPSISATTRETFYSVVFDMPVNATQLGIMMVTNHVGTAGANDWYELKDVQLEVTSRAQPAPSLFERRSLQLELELCKRYFFRLDETPTAAAVLANGMISATNVQTVCIPLAVPMRVAPTVAVVAGAFRFNIAGTLTAVGAGFAAGAAATQSPVAINVVGALTATAGQATQLVSGASGFGGSISASAEF